jgi:regulator of replication initiation timing
MIELTENLLYKLEEKMMLLLTDAEGLRQQIQRLQQENATLKQEKDNHTRKLQDLVSLLDSVSSTDQAAQYGAAYASASAKPVLVQA